MNAARLEVVTCISFVRDTPSPAHDLARAFRAGDPDAFATVLAQARATLDAGGARLVVPGTLGVAVPGHRAGSSNAPCEALVAALAAEIPGLVPGPGVLVRVADATEGKTGPARDAAEEAATLRWRGDLVPPGVRRVLLVDDVVRTGASLEAAWRVVAAPLAAATAAFAVFHAQQDGAGLPARRDPPRG